MSNTDSTKIVIVNQIVVTTTGQPDRGDDHWSTRSWWRPLVNQIVVTITGQPDRGDDH
jgi:hypothetical protein